MEGPSGELEPLTLHGSMVVCSSLRTCVWSQADVGTLLVSGVVWLSMLPTGLLLT